MEVGTEIAKVTVKLKTSIEAGETINIALRKQEEKKQAYQGFINNKDGGFDSEALLNGLVSIDANIVSLKNAGDTEKRRQDALSSELLGLEALSRMSMNGK